MQGKQRSDENRRVVNATPTSYDGISFKSRLEVMIYKTLKEQGLNPLYEGMKYVLIGGFKPTVPFYTKDSKTKMLRLNGKKLIDSTYSPDFILKYNGYTVIIEGKGFLQDSYVLKRKLFRKYLEDLEKCHEEKFIYFEVYTKKQLLQAIDIIKSLKQDTQEYDRDTKNA